MSSIHNDVRANNLAGVTEHLSQGVEVDEHDSNGHTPLMVAVTNERVSVEMVRLLLQLGADVNAVIHAADPETNYRYGYSVLALAVQEGTLATIQLLLAAGADIGYRRDSGYDALIDAMYSQVMTTEQELLGLVELLLQHGASVDGESDYGESALSVSSHCGRFAIVRRLLQAGADAQVLAWDDLLHAVALGSVQDVQRLLATGADLTVRDGWERTPWLLSLQSGDLEKARLLLAAGANRNEVGRLGQTALMLAIENEQVDVLSWLIVLGVNLDAQDEFGSTALMKAAEQGCTECVRRLIEAGANVRITDAYEGKGMQALELLQELDLEMTEGIKDKFLASDQLPGETAITKAANVEIVRLLVEAGENLGDISDEMRAELTGLESEGEVICTPQEYHAGKYRRFGKANPQLMEIVFWKAMVRSGATAYRARDTFGDTGNYEDKPVWCFHRFGKSITELPDGRIIEVGGEHEDSYDPDFCIYNDVFVQYGGGRFEIYSYPKSVFPPTDFHSATRVGKVIYLIGNLGYEPARISGETPVFRLHCDSWKIEAVPTAGDKPGWISRHQAVHRASDSGGDEIVIRGGMVCERVKGEEVYRENPHLYVLNLSTRTWRREES